MSWHNAKHVNNTTGGIKRWSIKNIGHRDAHLLLFYLPLPPASLFIRRGQRAIMQRKHDLLYPPLGFWPLRHRAFAATVSLMRQARETTNSGYTPAP